MNRHLIIQRQLGFQRPLSLPKYELENIAREQREKSKAQEQVEYSEGLNKLCYALLKGTPNTPAKIPELVKVVEKESENLPRKIPDLICTSVKDKATKTSSQIKIDTEKQKQAEVDEELIQTELTKKTKPAERLFNKLVKKHVKKKIPAHIKKKVQKIREIEGKEHLEESQNNKILNAVKSVYVV